MELQYLLNEIKCARTWLSGSHAELPIDAVNCKNELISIEERLASHIAQQAQGGFADTTPKPCPLYRAQGLRVCRLNAVKTCENQPCQITVTASPVR